MPATKGWSVIAALALAAMALVGTLDAQDAERSQDAYCEMLAIWDADAAAGIAPEERNGWPPYDGRDQCAKMQQ